MGTITIGNPHTIKPAHVRVTAANGDTGGGSDEGFFEILPGKFHTWERNQWQVAFSYLEYDESTHVFVAIPGATHFVKAVK